MTVKTLPMILTALLALSACGQKGPLYLEESEADLAAEAVAGESAGESNEGVSENESSDESVDAKVKE